ncbi:hypothetical protein F6Q07_05645 [Pectobacterium parmentieri]|nr:hypothetical protein C5E26_06710 [Pectobacterium parmentieri]AYH26893.1 hypothetical protein C5E20_06960 [Pectobacterium parmentieri]AYH31342.1 hypothetical protein C5E19_06730 [Pectobacterium parmentieri]MBI0517619.1 hypothetical protein [Pectobacterium parmentieri]QHQ18784.1 hypothetical protein GMW39_11835 [Pectobacterium parmentieri]
MAYLRKSVIPIQLWYLPVFFPQRLAKTFTLLCIFILPSMAFAIDVLWYAVVACVLSTDGPHQAYIKYRKFIDKFSGGVMVFLGIRFLLK